MFDFIMSITLAYASIILIENKNIFSSLPISECSIRVGVPILSASFYCFYSMFDCSNRVYQSVLYVSHAQKPRF